MGYRSEVAGLIYAPQELVSKFKKDHADVMQLLDDEFNDGSLKYLSDEVYDFIYLHGKEWKWYDDYKEVKAWHDLMDLAEKDGLAVEFVRIGEEYDDIETDYRGASDMLNYYLNVERFIEVNC